MGQLVTAALGKQECVTAAVDQVSSTAFSVNFIHILIPLGSLQHGEPLDSSVASVYKAGEAPVIVLESQCRNSSFEIVPTSWI